MTVELIGFTASLVSALLFTPQAVRVWTFRHDNHALTAISLHTQTGIICNATLWAIYGYLTHAFWVAAPGLLNAPLAIMTIHLVHRSRKTPPTPNACLLCLADVPHSIVIHTAPGAGSVIPCTHNSRQHGTPILFTPNTTLEHDNGQQKENPSSLTSRNTPTDY